jgi:hypothetical protein
MNKEAYIAGVEDALIEKLGIAPNQLSAAIRKLKELGLMAAPGVAIGAPVGALTGAIAADEGKGLQGAGRGALLGAGLGGMSSMVRAGARLELGRGLGALADGVIGASAGHLAGGGLLKDRKT